MDDKRNNPEYINSEFEVIIITCSLKNIDRSFKINSDDTEKMYYCTECGQMHHGSSRIGKLHKKRCII